MTGRSGEGMAMEAMGTGVLACFAVKNRNEEIRTDSRSGGAFSALAYDMLSRGGSVYGCALSDDFSAEHVRIVSPHELSALRGSKYVQSDTTRIWKSLESDLASGMPVLFSGTPCQIAAVRSFVHAKGLSGANLLCVDLVCHGVPSPAVWQKFLRDSEKKWGGPVEAVLFRDKGRFGWKAHQESIRIGGLTHSSKTFARLFYTHLALRPACFECPYKSSHRQGDVTLADFWGIDDAIPGFNDDKGVSLVLISSEKGREVFDRVKATFEYREVSLESCLQPALVAPFATPGNRNKFWDDFPTRNIWWLERRYTKRPLWKRALTKIKKTIKAEVG